MHKVSLKIEVGVDLTQHMLFISSTPNKPDLDLIHYCYAVNCQMYESVRKLTPQAQGTPVTPP